MPRTTASRLAICSGVAATTAVAVAACASVLTEATQESGGLTLIQFMPAGEFRPSDGRVIDVPSWRINAAAASAVIARHEARQQPVVIDYEHQTLHKEKNGQPAPAAGWLRGLRWVEGKGLYGTVALTDKARTAIDAGEYLYFSPVFDYSTEDGTVLSVRMGALTNDPGIHGMPPLSLMAAATAFFPVSPQEPSVNPLFKALLAALGLPDTTTEPQAIAALTAIGPLQALQTQAGVATAACTALKLPANATAEAVTAACSAIHHGEAITPDPSKYVPIEAVTELKSSLAVLTARQLDVDIEAAVAPALADGRLLPSMEKWARDLGKSNMAALTAFLGTAQPIAALTATQTQGKPPALASGDAQLSASELAVCSAMGLTPEQYKAGAAVAVA